MCVHILNILRREVRSIEGRFQRLDGTGGLFCRLCQMECVGSGGVREDLGTWLGASLLGVLDRFQYQDRRSFADHEAVSLGIEGTGCPLWLVVACGQSAHHIEAGDGDRVDGSFAASRQDHFRVSAADDLGGLSDDAASRGTG